MSETSKQMQKLIEDLLFYSRTKKAELHFTMSELQEVVEEVIAECGDSIKTRGAVVIADGSCRAAIIRFQFHQLLFNLINNALKFTSPDRKPQITIKVETLLNANLQNISLLAGIPYCHISVADNGIGFDPQYKDRIFEIFERLNSQDQYPGTGIGLAICRKIVENHKGIITANGEPGKGACFDIYLPIKLS